MSLGHEQQQRFERDVALAKHAAEAERRLGIAVASMTAPAHPSSGSMRVAMSAVAAAFHGYPA